MIYYENLLKKLPWALATNKYPQITNHPLCYYCLDCVKIFIKTTDNKQK